jgi:hypothetical protein
MSEIELREFYASKINEAETAFERQMIQAELKHKLKMIEEGVDAEENRRNSQISCVGCGS